MRDAAQQIDHLQRRLQAWAAWLTSEGSGVGYPTKSVLHSSWMPPAPGQTPSMMTSGGGSDRAERAMHAAILSLSTRLQDTLVVVYVMRAAADEQARQLACQPATVRARVAEARRLLGLMRV